MQKTSIYSSTNTRWNVRDESVQDVGARVCGDAKKYLGLSTMIGKSKYKFFDGLRREYEIE